MVFLIMYKLNRKLTMKMADELDARRKAVSPITAQDQILTDDLGPAQP